MATIQLDTDEIAEAIRPAIQRVLREVIREMQKNEEIKMLSRQDIMKIFGVSESKGSAIMKQLPKLPGVGHRCVPETWLRKWIDEHVQWVEQETGYFGDFEKLDLEEVISDVG